MMQEKMLARLKGFSIGMAELLGTGTEVILYNLQTGKPVFAENGDIAGIPALDESLYTQILNPASNLDRLIGCKNITPSGRVLRSSYFIFRDDSGEPVAMLCINQDMTPCIEMQKFLDSQLSFRPVLQEKESADDENLIQKTVKQIIKDSIERVKSGNPDSKEIKREAIRLLERQGVFTVKDSVPQVCKMLSVSQATLYNYLRELRVKSN